MDDFLEAALTQPKVRPNSAQKCNIRYFWVMSLAADLFKYLKPFVMSSDTLLLLRPTLLT